MFYNRELTKELQVCHFPDKSSLSIFAVVGFVKISRNTLLAPDLSACSSWIFSKVTISFNEIQVNCTHRFFYRKIVTVVGNAAGHAAEYRFDYV